MGNAGTLVDKLLDSTELGRYTPGIRMVASALPAAGPAAVPAAALGEGGLLVRCPRRGCSVPPWARGPTVVARAGVRGRIKPLKDLKDAHSPERMQRLVAQISEKPESVQHHSVDQADLDSLLEQLAKNPASTPCTCLKATRPKSCRPRRRRDSRDRPNT